VFADGKNLLDPAADAYHASVHARREPADRTVTMNFDEVRRMALGFPGAEESAAGGTWSFRVRGTLFARVREDGESLVLKCNPFERAYLLDDFPDVFSVLEAHPDYPVVVVRISAVTPEMLRERMEASWRIVAPRKLITELEGGRSAPG
jgi:hypothetical protein